MLVGSLIPLVWRDRIGHLPSELSGGERERVAIARALLMNPSLILADEPTGNLDRKTAEQVTAVLLDLQRSSGAILIAVTHSDSLAAAMAQRRELIDGQLGHRVAQESYDGLPSPSIRKARETVA